MATALHITDDITTCDCCGRTGLKRTVLMRLDDDSLAHYGTTCAARNTGKTSQQITKEVRAEQQAAWGRTLNRLSGLRREGVTLTRQLMREVAAGYRADVDAFMRTWGHWATT